MKFHCSDKDDTLTHLYAIKVLEGIVCMISLKRRGNVEIT